MALPNSPTGSHDLNDMTHNELAQTIGALEAGVTALAPRTAIGIIDVWYDTLKNAEGEELHDIADLLDDLRTHLQGDDLDAGAIGDLLLRLGDRTTAVAAMAEDTRVTPGLERLGAILTRAGEMLGGDAVDAHQPDLGQPDLGQPDLGQGARTPGFGGTTAQGSKPSASSDPDLDTSPTKHDVSRTGQGLDPHPDDDNPGSTTGRPS